MDRNLLLHFLIKNKKNKPNYSQNKIEKLFSQNFIDKIAKSKYVLHTEIEK